ncbi:hypothetical protein C8Q76DRAFT_752881 [Earliella scabrosa]|nr:hypothetical protein C8Q76DRAFT_752881 [Earliella scabrosa]
MSSVMRSPLVFPVSSDSSHKQSDTTSDGVSPPADILCLIVDALVTEVEEEYDDFPHWRPVIRQQEMRACALVCKAMLSRANYHLYNDVTLIARRQVPCLARTIAEREDLALLVNHLSVNMDEFLSVGHSERFNILFPSPLITRLSNLKSLKLDNGYTLGARLMDPATLEFTKLFAAGCPFLEDLSLIHLSFTSYKDFIGLVWSFPRLRQMTMSMLSLDRSEVYRTPRLNWNQFDRLSRTATLPTEPRLFSSLTSLAVEGALRPPFEDISSRVWGPNLKRLRLRTGSALNFQALSTFTELEHLVLEMHISTDVQVLKSICPKHLHTVEVEQDVAHYPNFPDELLTDYTEVDAILAQPTFGNLRRVLWRILRSRVDPEDEARWVQDIFSVLPRARERDILHVSVRCGTECRRPRTVHRVPSSLLLPC